MVTSGYHMPRAMAEIAHQLPGVTLVAFPVFSEKLRLEPWWSSTTTLRLLLLEYLKFLFSQVRMHGFRAPAWPIDRPSRWQQRCRAE